MLLLPASSLIFSRYRNRYETVAKLVEDTQDVESCDMIDHLLRRNELLEAERETALPSGDGSNPCTCTCACSKHHQRRLHGVHHGGGREDAEIKGASVDLFNDSDETLSQRWSIGKGSATGSSNSSNNNLIDSIEASLLPTPPPLLEVKVSSLVPAAAAVTSPSRLHAGSLAQLDRNHLEAGQGMIAPRSYGALPSSASIGLSPFSGNGSPNSPHYAPSDDSSSIASSRSRPPPRSIGREERGGRGGESKEPLANAIGDSLGQVANVLALQSGNTDNTHMMSTLVHAKAILTHILDAHEKEHRIPLFLSERKERAEMLGRGAEHNEDDVHDGREMGRSSADDSDLLLSSPPRSQEFVGDGNGAGGNGGGSADAACRRALRSPNESSRDRKSQRGGNKQRQRGEQNQHRGEVWQAGGRAGGRRRQKRQGATNKGDTRHRLTSTEKKDEDRGADAAYAAYAAAAAMDATAATGKAEAEANAEVEAGERDAAAWNRVNMSPHAADYRAIAAMLGESVDNEPVATPPTDGEGHFGSDTINMTFSNAQGNGSREGGRGSGGVRSEGSGGGGDNNGRAPRRATPGGDERWNDELGKGAEGKEGEQSDGREGQGIEEDDVSHVMNAPTSPAFSDFTGGASPGSPEHALWAMRTRGWSHRGVGGESREERRDQVHQVRRKGRSGKGVERGGGARRRRGGDEGGGAGRYHKAKTLTRRMPKREGVHTVEVSLG